jgi:hypothetical protein
MVALPALIFWLLNYPFMLIVYQEPMILQWAKVVTVIPLTINSQDNSDEDYIDLGHKMKKRVMALLVHNKTSWVGLSAEPERQGHPQSGQVAQ